MKSVLVCAAQAPFITGGAEILVTELRANLERRGFRADVAAVPFKWYPVSELVRQALAWRLLDVSESNGTRVDLVIPTKFPSFLVRHPRKVTWLFHQHREAYDLYGTPYCSFQDTPEDGQVRDAIHAMDTSALAECRALFTISRNVADRLRRYNGLCGEPLYPPPHHLGRYRTEGFGDYLFYAGRLDRLKRLDLAVDAMRRVRSGAKLKIAGDGPLGPELRKQIDGLGLSDRVEMLGFVSPEDLLALYAGCRAAYYAPLNEDYGYVTVEAFLSGKPVVTTSDAGGVLEFVTTGRTGLVAEPVPEAIAAAIDELWALPEARLRDMGEAGRASVADISWDRVIDRLTESIR
ncbi:MAG TPA: glycosyltransferase family 4 protein [Vicinamibacteria bacterium]|nr:glycosyltransferase family 4 protein [Vicinamibacteria bacterium]